MSDKVERISYHGNLASFIFEKDNLNSCVVKINELYKGQELVGPITIEDFQRKYPDLFCQLTPEQKTELKQKIQEFVEKHAKAFNENREK